MTPTIEQVTRSISDVLTSVKIDVGSLQGYDARAAFSAQITARRSAALRDLDSDEDALRLPDCAAMAVQWLTHNLDENGLVTAHEALVDPASDAASALSGFLELADSHKWIFKGRLGRMLRDGWQPVDSKTPGETVLTHSKEERRAAFAELHKYAASTDSHGSVVLSELLRAVKNFMTAALEDGGEEPHVFTFEAFPGSARRREPDVGALILRFARDYAPSASVDELGDEGLLSVGLEASLSVDPDVRLKVTEQDDEPEPWLERIRAALATLDAAGPLPGRVHAFREPI